MAWILKLLACKPDAKKIVALAISSAYQLILGIHSDSIHVDLVFRQLFRHAPGHYGGPVFVRAVVNHVGADIWTTDEIRFLILKEFCVEYTLKQVRVLLKN
jgi:transposase